VLCVQKIGIKAPPGTFPEPNAHLKGRDEDLDSRLVLQIQLQVVDPFRDLFLDGSLHGLVYLEHLVRGCPRLYSQVARFPA
jgi:hypothetical protein